MFKLSGPDFKISKSVGRGIEKALHYGMETLIFQ